MLSSPEASPSWASVRNLHTVACISRSASIDLTSAALFIVAPLGSVVRSPWSVVRSQRHESFLYLTMDYGPRTTDYGLSLLQILLDAFRFPQEERHMFVGGADKAGQDLHRLLELLAELLVLLVAPGVAQSVKLAMDRGQAGLQ